MIKNDKWIREQATKGMIAPFEPEMIRTVDNHKVFSYGTGSYSYDLRLSAKEFKVFRHIPGSIVNPKAFNPSHLEDATLHTDEYGEYFILPAHTYGLGVAVERLEVPDNIQVVCMGKSSYCRVGAIVNMSPAESGWKGHLTLEISNSSCADIRIYANEGICVLLFFEGDDCEVSYDVRPDGGKYQNQLEEITYTRI